MIDENELLPNIPLGLRSSLLESYRSIQANFSESRWEPAELNGGKFSEVVYSIIAGALSGNFPEKPSKPSNMRDACQQLERLQQSSLAGDRSLRILIPRVLQVLYEIRNNRGVSHVGGDVDPNHMDATAVCAMSSWVLAELIRVFNSVPLHEAQAVVDALVERVIPLIWDVEGTKRILNPQMPIDDQTLVLLYHSAGWTDKRLLIRWVEYESSSMFATRFLKPLHRSRLIEYDSILDRARISPLGVKWVEDKYLRRHSK